MAALSEREMATLARSAERSPANRRIYADALDEAGECKAAERQRLLACRRVYYIHHPRNFSNEYDVFVVPAPLAGRLEVLLPDASRINRKRAIERGWTRPREARRDGEQWYGGFFANAGPVRDIRGILDEICAATVDQIEEWEAEQDAREQYRREMADT